MNDTPIPIHEALLGLALSTVAFTLALPFMLAWWAVDRGHWRLVLIGVLVLAC